MFDAGPAVAALQAWYATDPYASTTGLYHWDDPNLAADLGQPNKTLADVEKALVSIYGYTDAFQDTTLWWNDANAITALIDYMLVTNDRQYLSVVENTFNNAPNAFTVSINGIEVGGLKGAVGGAAAGAEVGGSIGGPIGAGIGAVIGAIAGFFGGGGSSASNVARVHYTNFLDQYYDDEGWWALAWLKAYDLTQDPKYLDMAETIFDDMAGGWDTTFGGGIFWAKDHKNADGTISPYKNAIANELFMAVATRLYLRTKNVSYLSFAEKEWAWFSESGLIAEKGDPNGTDSACQMPGAIQGTSGCPGAQHLVYDSLTAEGNPDASKTFWTYNCGVILQALCDLSIITGNPDLLSTAQNIGTAAVKYFQFKWDTGLKQLVSPSTSFGPPLTERNPSQSVQTCQFKGILIRNLATLFANDPKNGAAIGEFITNNAKSVLANINPASQIGKEWNQLPDTEDFVRQSAGIDAINAANRVLIFTTPISLTKTLALVGLKPTAQLRGVIGGLTTSIRSWVTVVST